MGVVMVHTKRVFLLIVSLSTSLSLNSSILTDISRITASTKYWGPVQAEGQPITVYSHGLMCNKWIGGLHHNDSLIRFPYAFIQGPMVSFHYRDWLAPLSTCVAQEDDLEQLHSVCQQHSNIILAGCSRGAGAIVNYLGMYKPNNVIGAVIESPFDHTRNVINYLAQQLHIQKRSIIDAISTNVAPNHKQDGIQPIDYIAEISHEIPLFFICTTKDRIIPVESSIKLYKESRKAGHPRVHLLITEHGAHGGIAMSSDGAMMRNTIHAFYKEYGLPYNAEWAQAGATHFAQCQPSIDQLEKTYPSQEVIKK